MTLSPKPYHLALNINLPKIMSAELHAAEEWGTGVSEGWKWGKTLSLQSSSISNLLSAS